jgi:ABC-type multidrug transport system ATPase subunit/ABC-type multidrug transport system permease subunit
MPSSVINVREISKTFISQTSTHRIVKALDNINLNVFEGEILGVLGPNGAGKTTTLNILSTLLLPDKGQIEILGIKYEPRNFDRLRRLINMTSGYPNFPWSLTVSENLRFYGRLYGLHSAALARRVEELIEMFSLQDFANLRFDELSSGTKQRLSLAKSLLNRPRIVFLDEPTVGLDPDVALKTREVILNILKRSKVTVLLTTHNMAEAEAMCDRIAFIKQGQVLKVATPQELKDDLKKEDLEEVFIDLAKSEMKHPLRAKEQIFTSPVNVQEVKVGFFENIYLWINRCRAFFARNILFSYRNVFTLVELVFWPIVSLISIGLMGDFLRLEDKALAFVLTGAIAAGTLQVAQLDVAYSLLYEVWSKSMKHTMLTPIGLSESLIGSWIVGILRGTLIFIILSIAAVLMFKFKFPGVGITAVFLLGLFGSALLLGLLVTVLILMYGQKAEITAWMFAYVFMLLCGIYYPIDTLPIFFYNLAQFIPITYFLEYFRQSFGFTSQLTYPLFKGFGLTIVYFAIGMIIMKQAFHQARKKGIIVRLSE